jgi:MFS family permease
VHRFVVALLMGPGGLVAARSFIPETHEPEPAAATTAAAAVRGGAAERRARTRRALSAWTESRTLLIGVFMLAFSFAEGAGYDWISLSTIDGYDQPATVGTIAFATFVAAMTGLRWVGPALLDRYGRVPVLRCLAALAGVGLLLFVYGPNLATALVGVILWGAGVSLGFPTGISAASDQPAHAAARVSVVASIGYCAFLTGPPVIGFLGDHLSVLRSLTVLVGLVALAFAVAGALRPLPHGEPSGAGLSGPPGGRR